MIRFAIIGSGWRSLYYVRIAQAMPEEFEMCAMLCRTQEKADRMSREYHIHTTTQESEIKRLHPDFIVSAVSKDQMYETCVHWLDEGFGVLSETPVSLDFDRLCEAWRRHVSGRKLQVAEQYFLRPDYAEILRVIDDGRIGEPVSVTISAMHDYHAASIIRRALHLELEEVAVTGKKFVFPVANTRTRYETLTDGELCYRGQKHLILEYEGGKTAFYDFLSEQYRSTIRSRYLNVRGTRGETVNGTLYYLDENNLGREERLPHWRSLGGDNGEDEIAIAVMLRGMAEYLAGGEEIYPMRYALEDAYLTTLMAKAADTPYQTLHTAPRPWKD